MYEKAKVFSRDTTDKKGWIFGGETLLMHLKNKKKSRIVEQRRFIAQLKDISHGNTSMETCTYVSTPMYSLSLGRDNQDTSSRVLIAPVLFFMYKLRVLLDRFSCLSTTSATSLCISATIRAHTSFLGKENHANKFSTVIS